MHMHIIKIGNIRDERRLEKWETVDFVEKMVKT